MAISAPLLPSPIVAFTQQDFLDLFERLLPPHYLEPLKTIGPGYEVLQAAAAVGARLSLAVERFAADSLILSSDGGRESQGRVEFFRATPNPEGPTATVTILKGTVVQSSKGGRTYHTLADVPFLGTDLGPFHANIESDFKGYNYNEPAIVVTPDGSSLPGEIDTIVTLKEDPPVGDVTFQIRHTDQTLGGADAALDQHGADRIIFRGPGETDDSYRGRIRALPDNISPDAVERALQQLLLPYGLSYNFIETFEMGYQTCWDAPAEEIPGSVFNPNLFCYDDPRLPVPFRNRWLDENEMRGAFIVTVPAFGPLADYGLAYDDTSMTASDLTNPFGSRAVGAWDAEAVVGYGYLFGSWDGYDLPRATSMKTLYDTLQSIKAAGIAAALELEGE